MGEHNRSGRGTVEDRITPVASAVDQGGHERVLPVDQDLMCAKPSKSAEFEVLN